MASDNKIIFFDTTLRDGEQSPGCTMHHEEKLRMAHQLATLGVDILEAGFSIASTATLRACAPSPPRSPQKGAPRIASLARAKREDIEAAAKLHRARRPRPHPHLPFHQRPAPRRQAEDHPRAGARPDRRHGRAR
jgi:2-isopropylmalate synthase